MGNLDGLELLLLARQDGLLSDLQVEQALEAWERDGADDGPAFLDRVAVSRGWLTSERVREIARRRTGAVAIDLSCVACGRGERLALLDALRRPRCGDCSGPLARAEAPSERAVPPPPPEPAPEPDRRFGKYVLLERIGTGGMGEVWSAWDTDLQRAVALKFPKIAGEEEVRRLYLEARGAGRLTHAGIASVYEVSEGPGRPFIAMQFIEGRTAFDEAEANRDPRQIARWIRDASRAVHFAHEHGVIHRDLKPSNLMVDATGRVFVMDFGLAKVQASALDSTVSGMLLGTPAYMPPEQACGRTAQVDARSDVYSLGATLYTLLCGRRPYEGESPTDVLLKIMATDPPPLRAQRPDTPLALESVVLKAMRRDKERRYPTAAAMADDLDRFLAGQPVSAPTGGITARWTARARRPVPAWKAAAAVLAALALGGLAWWSRPAPAAADRLPVWTELFGRLRRALDPDAFDRDAAAALLERVRREFPEQEGQVRELVDREHRTVEAALAALPGERPREARATAERYRAWLAFAGKPTGAADRLLSAPPSCAIAIDVLPRAELRGPIVEGLPPADRFTPLGRRAVEIAPGPLRIVAPGRPPVEVPLPALEDGGVYVLEGRLDDPATLRWRTLER